jgi:hypothetical protein
MIALTDTRLSALLEECLPGAELQSTREEVAVLLSKSDQRHCMHDCLKVGLDDFDIFSDNDDNNSVYADLTDFMARNEKGDTALFQKAERTKCDKENLPPTPNKIDRTKSPTKKESLFPSKN